jgi:hypothetical protein
MQQYHRLAPIFVIIIIISIITILSSSSVAASPVPSHHPSSLPHCPCTSDMMTSQALPCPSQCATCTTVESSCLCSSGCIPTPHRCPDQHQQLNYEYVMHLPPVPLSYHLTDVLLAFMITITVVI